VIADDLPAAWERLQSLLADYPAVRRLCVAYSGGIDSHVLLHWLSRRRSTLDGLELTAIYVDHGLQPASIAWGEHCAQVCRALNVAFEILRVDARPAPGESPEAAARQARYGALAARLTADGALLTAQHQDDQAETLLLQLLRGAGPHGLAAMPAAAPLGQGWLWRPLLTTTRAEITAYAQAQNLRWIEDASNADRRLDRNYLRHDILPLLRQRWPSAERSLARSAALCADAATLLDELADDDLAQVATDRPDCLAIAALRTLSESRQRNALRRWFRRLRLPPPAAVHLRHILDDAIKAPADRVPLIHWPGGEVRRYRNGLYAMAPLPPHDPTQVVPWPAGMDELCLPRLGKLSLQPASGAGLRWADLTRYKRTVRFRRGGENLLLPGRSHHRALKNLLQAAGIPPWERERLPLLYLNDNLAAVGARWTAAEFTAAADQAGAVLTWQKPAPSANL